MHASRIVTVAVATMFAATAACSDNTTDPNSINDFSAGLNGASEKPTAVLTDATGSATFTYTGSTITYNISYSALEGGNPTAAHIHLGSATQSTGAALHLCGGPAPACPASASGTITGTADAAHLIGTNNFAGIANAMRGFGAYVNIHNAVNANGEIRGNIVPTP